jgi:[acyl-carrier-protein] S-malonyltransferase
VSGNRVAATVAGRRIRLSDVEARASVLRSGPAARHAAAEAATDDWVRRWAVQQLVGEAILLHEAQAASAPTGRIRGAIERLVARITEAIEISEHDVRSFYERNLDRYRSPERRRVRLVVLASREDAERAREDLVTGGGGAVAVMELRRGDYVGAFEAAVFAARVGGVVGPTPTEHGWMVARVESVIDASTAPYSAARAGIAAELLAVARARAFDDWLELRRHELARVAPQFEHPAHPALGQARHRH